MKIAKILSFVVVVAFILGATGCGPAATTAAPAAPATQAPAAPATAVPPTTAPATAAPKTTSAGYPVPVQKCAPNCTYKDMVVGFIQTGPESAWRTANNASFDETAKQQGITLKVYDAQGKVENQISAFHTFNQDPTVNVIMLAADDMKGYDHVLQEAQANGKLVILEDRSIDSSASLYYTHIGSDFVHEGQEGAAAMCDLLKNMTKKNVVEISGAVGASAGIDRDKGFRQKMGDCGITITASQTGNWAVADSKAVMEAWLKIRPLKTSRACLPKMMRKLWAPSRPSRKLALRPARISWSSALMRPKTVSSTLICWHPGRRYRVQPAAGPQVYEAALKGLNGDATIPSCVPSQEGQFFAAQGADALNAILATRKY